MATPSILFVGHSMRQFRRAAVARKMAAMRAAKERKRLAAGPPAEEPRGVRFHRLEVGVRDKITGEVAFTDFRSVRDATKRLREVFIHCQ